MHLSPQQFHDMLLSAARSSLHEADGVGGVNTECDSPGLSRESQGSISSSFKPAKFEGPHPNRGVSADRQVKREVNSNAACKVPQSGKKIAEGCYVRSGIIRAAA